MLQPWHTFDCIILGIIVSGSLILIVWKIKNYIKDLEKTLLNRLIQDNEKNYGLELEKFRALTIIAEEISKANRKGLNR